MTPAELRDLYGDESLVLRLTSSAPPVTMDTFEHTKRDGSVWYEVIPNEELANQIGANMSGQMVSLIGGIGPDLATYSPRWPVRRALQEWERTCRRRHQPSDYRWQDHRSGPLCSDLLRATSIGVSLRWCSEAWGVPYPRAERLRDAGLRFVNERLARWQDEQLGLVHDREQCEQCREEDQGA